MKDLGKDIYGVQRTMRRWDYFGDSLGQFANNAMGGLVGQLTYFYTDKAGVAAASVATVLMLCKIIDAFTDLIMGNILDHTKPGKEKFRPWILKAGIPSAITLILLFTVPKVGDIGQIAYVFITNILFTSIFLTAFGVPYGSLQIVRTNSQEERGRMGTWRAASGYVSGMIMAVAIIPITNLLGGTQSAWIKFAVISSAVIILALLICYKTSREVPVGEEISEEQARGQKDEVPFKVAVVNLFKNKYWVMLLIMNFFVNILYGLSNSSGAYYAKWIYGDDNLMGIMGAAGLIPTFIGFALVGVMVKHLGVVKTLKVSFVIGFASNILKIINPYNFIYNLILGLFGTFANIPMMCLMGVLLAMAVDYNEYKYGDKMVGCSASASNFGCKVGSGIGASIIGWCLGIAGYDATLAVAPMTTQQAIFTFSIYIPMIMFVILFIMACKFDLEKKIPQIREEIKKRDVQNKR